MRNAIWAQCVPNESTQSQWKKRNYLQKGIPICEMVFAMFTSMSSLSKTENGQSRMSNLCLAGNLCLKEEANHIR